MRLRSGTVGDVEPGNAVAPSNRVVAGAEAPAYTHGGNILVCRQGLQPLRPDC